MTNGSKFEPREQMNRALKPRGVGLLNLSRTILESLCCPDFYFKCFFNLLIRTQFNWLLGEPSLQFGDVTFRK